MLPSATVIICSLLASSTIVLFFRFYLLPKWVEDANKQTRQEISEREANEEWLKSIGKD